MKVVIPDLVSNSYFPAIAAVEMGFFKEEGLDAELEMIYPVDNCYRALRDGKCDFVGGSAHSVPAAFTEWQGAKLLGTLAKHTYWFLIMRSDLKAKRGDVTALDVKVRAHDQEPVGVLRQRAEEFDAVPFRKGRRRRMRRAADEVGLAVPQRLVAFADRIDQLEFGIEAFFLEEAHLHRGDGGEIRIGDEIGNDDFHETLLLPFIRQRHDPVAVLECAAQHRILQLHVERSGI